MHAAGWAARSRRSHCSWGEPARQPPTAEQLEFRAIRCHRADVEAVVTLPAIAGGRAEVPVVAGRAGRPVLVVAGRRLRDRLHATPGRVVRGDELRVCTRPRTACRRAPAPPRSARATSMSDVASWRQVEPVPCPSSNDVLSGSQAMSPAAAIRTPLTAAWDAVSGRVAAGAFSRRETATATATAIANAATTSRTTARRRFTVSPYAASALP